MANGDPNPMIHHSDRCQDTAYDSAKYVVKGCCVSPRCWCRSLINLQRTTAGVKARSVHTSSPNHSWRSIHFTASSTGTTVSANAVTRSQSVVLKLNVA